MNSIRKAIAAAVVAGAGALGTAAAGEEAISINQWLVIIAATIGAFGATWGIANQTSAE